MYVCVCVCEVEWGGVEAYYWQTYMANNVPIIHINAMESAPRLQTHHHVCNSEEQFTGPTHNGMRERPSSLSWTYMME